MDYDDYMLMREEQREMEGKDEQEEECGLCKAFPCRCDHIYDSWRDDGVYV